jgi:uncharacterized membrane protein YbaN (DUF454 family)
VKPVSRLRKTLDWSVGLSLVALGLVGLVLPGLQGILLILGGLAVLSSHSPLARRLLERVKATARSTKDRLVKRTSRE